MTIDFEPHYNRITEEIERLRIKELYKKYNDMYEYLAEIKRDYKCYMKMYKILINKPNLINDISEQMKLLRIRYKIVVDEYIK
ncbi:MAG: hypothetical protein K0R54_6149 [Clostridiaceae bacterium]|jgi:hypothetical protein|nr:hypothetical protein [Clostridiaceae bacterium]